MPTFMFVGRREQGPRRGWGWGGFSPPTFLAVDVRTLNVQLEIFVLMRSSSFLKPKSV